MDYSERYDYLVQRFLPSTTIKDIGYDVGKYTEEEINYLFSEDSLHDKFWGLGTEFVKKITTIIKMYPLVFYDNKAIQRLQQLCLMKDIIEVPDESLKKVQATHPGIDRNHSFEDIKTYVMYPSDNFYSSSKLAATFPSDRVIINNGVTDRIEDIWNKNKKNLSAPCDLIETKMLPAPDIELQMKDTIYRVKICPENNDSDLVTKDNHRTFIGFMTIRSAKTGFSVGIELSEDLETGLICMEKAVSLNQKIVPTDYFNLCQVTSNAMQLWYGVQLLMLHPRIKYVFEHPKMQVFFNPYLDKSVSKNKKRKTFSVRTIKITNTTLEYSDNSSSKGSHTYNCPLWYVIGHKRCKKSGKTEWVKGYWKGELRKLAKPEDYEVRKRELE